MDLSPPSKSPQYSVDLDRTKMPSEVHSWNGYTAGRVDSALEAQLERFVKSDVDRNLLVRVRSTGIDLLSN